VDPTYDLASFPTRRSSDLRKLYAQGLAELDSRTGGDFASASATAQDTALRALDLGGSKFFTALFNHTMEGVYGHPVYGGNRHYRSEEHTSELQSRSDLVCR